MGGRGSTSPHNAGLRTIDARLSSAQRSLLGDILGEYDRVWSTSTNPESRVSPGGRLRRGTIWSTVPGASIRTYRALENMGFIEIVDDSGTFPVVRPLARLEG